MQIFSNIKSHFFYSNFLSLGFSLGLSCFSSELIAHARLKSGGTLSPRNNNPGLKIGPCGGVARTNTAKEFQAGQKINIQWEETINHPGRYEFYFSKANDENFILLKTVVDEQNDRILNANYHQYETEITLPMETCEACTIQMIQVMTENPSNPSLYFSCADIKLNPVDPVVPPENPEPPVITPEPDPLPPPPPTPEDDVDPNSKDENPTPMPEENPESGQDAQKEECH